MDIGVFAPQTDEDGFPGPGQALGEGAGSQAHPQAQPWVSRTTHIVRGVCLKKKFSWSEPSQRALFLYVWLSQCRK